MRHYNMKTYSPIARIKMRKCLPSSVITIRTFEPNDMFPVVKLASETLTEQYHPHLFNSLYETCPYGFIVAEKHHKLVGFIAGFQTSTTTGRISMLTISKTERRQGIASSLLSLFLTRMQEHHIREIELEVNTGNRAAVEFYKKNGFTITEKVNAFYQNGDDAYIMKRDL
jgi:ribosomal-protein-alanine N-acetyltransferase